jgi:hypothetical protein
VADTDLFDQFQKTITLAFNQHAEQFNKQIQPLTTLWNSTLTQFPNVVQAAVKQISERTIQVKIDGQANPTYTTEITNTADIVNTFPSKVPDPTDVYWTRHNQLVDKYLTDRQDTINKVISIIAETVKGLINPISTMTTAPVDLIKLIEALSTSSVKK